MIIQVEKESVPQTSASWDQRLVAWLSPDLKTSVLDECPSVSKSASAGVLLSLKVRGPGVVMSKGGKRASWT